MLAFLYSKSVSLHPMWIPLLSWIPGVVAWGCSKYFGHQQRDLALNLPKANKYFVIAYAIPALFASVVFLILIFFGIDSFVLSWDKSTVNRIFIAPVFGVLVSSLLSLGEEMGWRGFLQSRLIEMRSTHPFLITGLLWAAWSWPLILLRDHGLQLIPLVLFTLMTISFSIFLGQLRQASRSIWPSALAHGAHNTWLLGIYPHFLKAGPLDSFYGGESGIILAMLYLSLGIFLQRKSLQ